MDFLSGHSEGIVTRIEKDMHKASKEMRFEKAAALRDNNLKRYRISSRGRRDCFRGRITLIQMF